MSDRAPILYIHAKCCGGHWIIVKDPDGPHLACESCGKGAGGVGLAFSSKKEVSGTSPCHNVSYELVILEDGSWALLCEECGEEYRDVLVTGPDMSGCECAECQRKRDR